MKNGYFSFIVLVWTLVAVILHLIGVGQFAEWELTAWPWYWSCLCLMYWFLILYVELLGMVTLVTLYSKWKKEKRVINQYPPEVRAFIRRVMNHRK